MGKKNRPQKPKAPSPGAAPSSLKGRLDGATTQVPAEVIEAPDALHDQAIAGATDADLDQVRAPTPMEQPSVDDLRRLCQKADEARQLFEARAKGLQSEQAALTEARLRAEGESASLGERSRSLDEQESRLNEREAQLLARERDLCSRERNALAGFLAQNGEAVAELERVSQQLSDLRQQLATERTAFDDALARERQEQAERQREARAAFETELASARLSHDQRLKDEEQRLERERAAHHECVQQKERELHQAELALAKEQRELRWDRESLEEEERDLHARIERRAAARVEELQARVGSLGQCLAQAREERDKLHALLESRKDADRRFGNRTPEEVLASEAALVSEVEDLRRRLAELPGPETAERLRELDLARQDWETEKIDLLRVNQELKHRLARLQIGVVELETLRDQKRAYEESNRVLKSNLDELEAIVERKVGVNGRPVFEACLGMDSDPNLQSSPTTDAVSDLKWLADEARRRIAADPDPDRRLYYTDADIRSFVAGLHLSQLHILQGISGTGKTSLPLAFARCIGGHAEIVEVQAGWRDRQDLIGHFNSFEGTYHEEKLLRALYKAQCPEFADRLFFIVLDEMNLSYVEQYFADLLSALELPDPSQRRIELMASPVGDSAPRLLIDGKSLAIPHNVWFIGTANQDETTKDFAPKTYDRAHLMELPRVHPVFSVPPAQSAPPTVSVGSLSRAFRQAMETHRREAESVYSFLDSKLSEPLGRLFDVGWGNRLEAQIRRYVPVVLASGGSVGEAADFILALRVLRRIRNRYENQVADLDELRGILVESWAELDQSHSPVRSLEVIDVERRRLSPIGKVR